MDIDGNVKKGVWVEIYQLKPVNVEKSTEKGTARQTISALKHPVGNNLLVRSNERNVIGGRSTTFYQRLRWQHSISNERFEILFGGVADLKFHEVSRKWFIGDGRAGERSGLLRAGSESLGGSHGENSPDCERERRSGKMKVRRARK